jgi:hypothetical protein
MESSRQLVMHLAARHHCIRSLLPYAAQCLDYTMQDRPDVWGARCGAKQLTAEDAVRTELKQQQLGEQERRNLPAVLCYLRPLRCAGQPSCDAIAVQCQITARRPINATFIPAAAILLLQAAL